MKNEEKKEIKLQPIFILALGYIVIILLGTILLSLPFATNEGESTKIIDAFFTATSATCVTGLVPYDTFTHWTLFGQIVILVLIQIGGLGFMTFISLFIVIFRRNMGFYKQKLMMQTSATHTRSQIIPLIKRIAVASLLFELIGAGLLSLYFYPEFGNEGIYYSVFHSISAYCNAGFDIIGSGNSLVTLNSNPVVLFTISGLIIMGGLGFLVYSDIIDSKFRFKKFQLHTKIVLTFTLILIFVPALIYFILDFTNVFQMGAFSEMSFPNKLLNSLFMSITTRTAGFNAINLTELSGSSKLLTIVLMFIGGNTGSTAGGLKVTTFIIVIANLIAQAKEKDEIVMFKATIPNRAVKQASALFLSYVTVVLVSTFLICMIEPFAFEDVLFEVTSAIGTVGLSIGISGSEITTIATKIILAFLMFTGRIGAFTMFDLLFKDNKNNYLKKPEGRVLVG